MPPGTGLSLQRIVVLLHLCPRHTPGALALLECPDSAKLVAGYLRAFACASTETRFSHPAPVWLLLDLSDPPAQARPFPSASPAFPAWAGTANDWASLITCRERGIRKSRITALRGNIGPGSCEPLAACPSTDQYLTLFYVCFWVSTPYFTHIVDSVTSNS